MTDTIKMKEFVKYLTYDPKKAIVILVNDTLNLNIREDNVVSYTSVPNGDSYDLTLVLDSNIRESSDGGFYDGEVLLTYDKVDANLFFPNGFYTHRVPGHDFSLSSMLTILKKNTRVSISETECEVSKISGRYYIVFKEESLFWKGKILLKSIKDIEYN